MWFEAVLFCSAGIVLLKQNMHQCRPPERQTNMHLAVLAAAPALFMLMFQRAYSIQGLLAGYLAIGCMLCCRHLSGYLCKASAARTAAVYLLKILAAFTVGILVIYYDTTAEGGDAIAYQASVLLFVCITVLLLFSRQTQSYIRKLGLGIYIHWFACAAPVLGFYLIEQVYNTDFEQMAWKYSTGNILYLGCMLCILYCLLQKKKIAIGIFLTGCLIFGIANYYVGKFRGSPVMPSDLMSVGTAFQVAGGYEFQIAGPVVKSLLCWYACIAVICCLPEKEPAKRCIHQAAAASLAVCICAGYLCNLDSQEKYGWQLDPWDIGAAYRQAGSTFGFTALLKQIKAKMPDGYISHKADEILLKSKSLAQSTGQSFTQGSGQTNEARKPAIIAVMVETFSDLQCLGDFACSEPYLKHWYEVDDYACRGRLYVSTFGGGTANTEFEFLTGNSIGNCPAGIVPYQSYSLKNVGNLAGILEDTGYRTIAMHPQNKGNWNRMRAYQNLGFQEFLGIEDFTDASFVRHHISDQACMDKIIALYEENSGKHPFIFNVTMQDHGGYSLEEMQGMDVISLKGQQGTYEDVETYLTLVRESDEALFHLIQYFREVEEPVILCLFGDHQPRLDTAWTEQVMGKAEGSLSLEELEQKYAVPYMIWANFDTVCQRQEFDTSANYLGALLLENAGMEQTAYTQFLLEMRNEIPVLNAFGYLTDDNIWHSYEEETEVSSWIDDYRILQYNAMFDSKRNMENYK